ncbi:unnamed protein product [Peniophora sp. CBMAI 1063]|nr:unnamed protein product [Peniophora sp. CBMAI 1063]
MTTPCTDLPPGRPGSRAASRTLHPMSNEQRISIQSLSDDVFCLIFNEFHANYSAGGANKLGWVTPSHVCSRWRRILVDDCATLWARSLCTFPKALPIFVERVRDAMLTIRIDEAHLGHETAIGFIEMKESRDTLLDVIKQRSQQIQTIDITFPSIPQSYTTPADVAARRNMIPMLFKAEVLSGLMRKTLPYLQELRLIGPPLSGMNGSAPLSSKTAFVAPKLVCLELFHVQISAETLYNVLRNAPRLETLTIQWAGRDATTMSTDIQHLSEPLPLARLVNASLGGRQARLIDFLPLWRLILAHERVRLHVLVSPSTGDEGESSLVALAPWLQRTGGDMLSFSIATDRIGFAIASSTSTVLDPNPYLHFEFGDMIPGAGLFPRLLSRFITSVHPANIHVLDLDAEIIIRENITGQLEHLSAVRELRVVFGLEVAPLFILHDIIEIIPEIPPFFPALRTLVLKGTVTDWSTIWLSQGTGMLSNALQSRREAGFPVSKLILRGVGIGSQDERTQIDVMAQHVDEFVDERQHVGWDMAEFEASREFL